MTSSGALDFGIMVFSSSSHQGPDVHNPVEIKYDILLHYREVKRFG
jgi:hypothetical protein